MPLHQAGAGGKLIEEGEVPVLGVSLYGFLDEAGAQSYLRNSCVLADSSDQSVHELWADATNRLGELDIVRDPDMRDLPNSVMPYLQGVYQNPRFQSTLGGMKWSIKMIEIAPLIAFQFHVEVDRIDASRANATGQTPSIEEMLYLCLPHRVDEIPFLRSHQGSSYTIKCSNLNLRALGAGQVGFDPTQQVAFAGIAFGASSPFVQVVVFDGRYYLKNGYHRAYCLLTAGATHMPCILLEANDFAFVGAAGQGATFERPLLESEHPPTCTYLTDGRSSPVNLRRIARIINVSWSEVVFPEE